MLSQHNQKMLHCLCFCVSLSPLGKAWVLGRTRTIRTILSAAALLAVLLFATSLGEAIEAWQHHECAANPTCPICHLGQQVAGSAEQGQGLASPQRLGEAPSLP